MKKLSPSVLSAILGFAGFGFVPTVHAIERDPNLRAQTLVDRAPSKFADQASDTKTADCCPGPCCPGPCCAGKHTES